jgi:hypothetical protein
MAQRFVIGISRSLFPARKAKNMHRKPLTSAASAVIEQLEGRQLLSTTWFVSTTGSNNNPGTLGAPFATIQHAAQLAGPGDTVSIRGGVYHETVNPWHSGNNGAPITFQAYGNESVTVDGADPVSNWYLNPGYQAAQGWDLGAGNNEVFLDGKMMVEARWPNTSLDPSHPNLGHAQSGTESSTSTTLYDWSLSQPRGFWDGATIHLTPGSQWVAVTATVSDSGPGYITFNYRATDQFSGVSAGTPYYLSGKLNQLDSAGEWFLDSKEQLHVWPPASDNPANHYIEAKRRYYGFDLSGLSNITVHGINLFACSINTNANSNNIVLDHLNAQYVSQFVIQPNGWAPPSGGIQLNGNNDLLQNSQIAFSSGDGVYIGGNNDRVTNNIIHDADLNAGDSAGVRIIGSWAMVDHNTIYNTGRDGIGTFGWQAKILYNTIHDAMLQTQDGGGIYTVKSYGAGSEIAYNRVYNVNAGGFGAAGIYLDDNSSNWTVDHNITWNDAYALKMNLNSTSQHIYNNTFDASQESLAKTWGNYDWSGSTLANNIFTHTVEPGETGAMFQNNLYPGTDPRFANPWGADYSLQSSSPAINSGQLIAPYTNGYTGRMPDIGAIEYGTGGFSSGASIDWLPTPANMQHPPTPVSSPPPPPTPTPQVLPMATGTMAAASPDAQQGVQSNGKWLGYCDNGDWAAYKHLNFATGVSQIQMSLAVTDQYAGQTIQVRLDSASGPVVGVIHPRSTGSWTTFQTQTASISNVTGVHDLYLSFSGSFGIANVSWFKFS